MRPRGWSQFQHYHNRRPPWIKLHRSTLDDPDFLFLSIASKALAPLLWLLASETTDGSIPADVRWIAHRVNFPIDVLSDCLKELILCGLFVDASGSIASCSQDACAEREESRVEREEKQTIPQPPASVSLVFDHWKSVMSHPDARLVPKRKKLIEARLREGYSVDDLKAAVDGCKASDFHQGKNDSGKVYDDLTLILRSGDKVEQFKNGNGHPEGETWINGMRIK